MNKQELLLSESIVNRRGRALVVAATVLAGLTLVACTGSTKPSPDARNSVTTLPSTSFSTAPAPTIIQTPAAPQPRMSTFTTQPRSTGLAGCVPYFDKSIYKNHEYEVCSAYIGNVASAALRAYYKFGNNTRSYLADTSRQHLETRYWDSPRQQVEQSVNSWPKTSQFFGNHVETSISLNSLTSNLAADRALVQTVESWQVTQPSGGTLRNEPLHTKDSTLCRGRLPGHPLHEWFVVSEMQVPNFNCRAFDVAHNLKP